MHVAPDEHRNCCCTYPCCDAQLHTAPDEHHSCCCAGPYSESSIWNGGKVGQQHCITSGWLYVPPAAAVTTSWPLRSIVPDAADLQQTGNGVSQLAVRVRPVCRAARAELPVSAGTTGRCRLLTVVDVLYLGCQWPGRLGNLREVAGGRLMRPYCDYSGQAGCCSGGTLMQASLTALVVASISCHNSVNVHVSGTTTDAGCI
jgi:hypothetical protein